MTDIVSRLREPVLAEAFGAKAIMSGKLTERLMYERHDAAAEIERLRSALSMIEGFAGPQGDDAARITAWADNMDRICAVAKRAQR